MGKFAIARSILAGLVVVGMAGTAEAQKSTLDTVKERGKLRCSAHNGSFPAFFEVDGTGRWKGLDIDFCKAVATAILGSPDKVDYVPLSWAQRFPSLQSGDIDVLFKQTAMTFSRDTKLGLQFTVPYFFGGFQFMARAKSGIRDPKDLEGATVCTAAGTSIEPMLVDFMAANKVKFQLVTYEKSEELQGAYFSERCDAIAGYGPSLAVTRALKVKDPAEHVLLPFALGVESQNAAIRENDKRFLNVVNWTILALIKAEALGIDSRNVDSRRDELAAKPEANLEAARLLGVKPGIGAPLGLPENWAHATIKAVGNYGEIYDRNIGGASPYKLDRGFNRLWKDGGLIYSPAFD